MDGTLFDCSRRVQLAMFDSLHRRRQRRRQELSALQVENQLLGMTEDRRTEPSGRGLAACS